MGYQIYHTISIHKNSTTMTDNELIQVLCEYSADIAYALDIVSDVWNTCNNDMIELSKLFPKVVFLVHGEGEENDDIWNLYIKNGKSQKCPAQITYDEYNEKELS